MADSGALETMSTRLDKLYEFDREPVTEDRLHNGGRFAAVFSGEHVAGTEFVIGAFFVLHGVNAFDLLVGLLIGNLLAVLSWTFVCAPIATSSTVDALLVFTENRRAWRDGIIQSRQCDSLLHPGGRHDFRRGDGSGHPL